MKNLWADPYDSTSGDLLKLLLDTVQQWSKGQKLNMQEMNNVNLIIEGLLLTSITIGAQAGKYEWVANGEVIGGDQYNSETLEFKMSVQKVKEGVQN